MTPGLENDCCVASTRDDADWEEDGTCPKEKKALLITEDGEKKVRNLVDFGLLLEPREKQRRRHSNPKNRRIQRKLHRYRW